MTSACPSSPLERLVPEVREYETDQFHLGEDLEHLARVHQAGAPEAVIFYCARILDVLAAAALDAVLLEPSPNVFSNLDTLQQYNLIPTATRYWAHALRRTGNRVRHILGRVKPADAELAVLFAERLLEWFFRTYRYGLHLAHLTRDGNPLDLGASPGPRALLEALESPTGSPDAARWHPPPEPGDLLRTPTVPALLAEMLLDRGEHDRARTVLDEALAVEEFRSDLRLRQLRGLHASRTGNLGEARRWLESLYEQNPDDDETAGITAGLYKRLWQKNKHDRHWLEKSERAYRQGWKKSRRTNAYLGINAATTALWLGRPEARQVAEEVRTLLRGRAARLAGQGGAADLAVNYWDQVTLAEAELVRGDPAAARDLYRDAFARHAEQQRANNEVSRRQLGEILRALGLPDTPETFLGPTGG